MTSTPAPEERVAPTFFIPQSTRDNYLQIARDAAAATGITPKAAMGKLAADFERQHKDDPTAGFDHLAAWAKDADPDETTGPSPLALAQSRALESARRDPSSALQGTPEVVAAAVEAVQARADDGSTDPSNGVVSNPGPVPVKTGPAKKN